MKVLDASWYMPDEQRNPLQEYQVAHIPGALFFDVDGISDRTSNLPHMLPSEEAFVAAVSALGIENKDGVVVYDGKGIFSAARFIPFLSATFVSFPHHTGSQHL
uniref:Rhodanese domain-containing protein n=1 Tax=Lactuca sativa TaxID=4236 RepID=A0A9R1VPX4_LACSA|nr:hypothetical protein LSAT_V11C400177340 [Lactuca sativa]